MVFRLLVLLLLTASIARGESSVLRTYEDIRAALKDTVHEGRPVELTGEVQSYRPRRITGGWCYTIGDGTNLLEVYENPSAAYRERRRFDLMDRVRVRGCLFRYGDHLLVGFEESEVLSRGNASHLPVISPQQFYEGRFVGKLVRMTGTVRDAAHDDSDADYIHLTVCDDHARAQVMIFELDAPAAALLPYLGAQVAITGQCTENHNGARRHIGRMLAVSGLENAVITRPARTFDTAPDLETLTRALPQHIMAVGRHRTLGTVLATWREDRLLLRTDFGHLVRARLEFPPLPPVGGRICALGLPVTDFYNLNLIHASWRSTGTQPVATDAPIDATASSLLVNQHGSRQLMIRNHGKTIRITGVVRYLPDDAHPHARMQLESDGQIVAVDATAQRELLSGLEIGSTVSVTGTCIMESDNWNLDSFEAPEHGCFLVPRTADDILVLSRPSHWTPARLLALLGLLAAGLLGVIAWNVSLNRRANRRGRELAAEQLAHVSAELKVRERTRLAVELHDALSQTLTGVSMQIDTAAGAVRDRMPPVTNCLTLASRTIDACRLELRNTIWDLRSDALDEPDMNSAIRRTLCQNLAGIDLAVRFNVPREALSDNTAHAILKIIRELVANAIRHGKAKAIRIAGTIEGDRVRFSVGDDGYGFDPDRVPGIAEGHFGLQGIAERIERLNGELTIHSAPGGGAKITVAFPIPHSGE